MNRFVANAPRRLHPCPSWQPRATLVLCLTLAAAWSLHAQVGGVPVPTATPDATPTPAPTVSPIVATAGVPSLSDQNAYAADHTPQASVTLGAATPAANLAATNGLQADPTAAGDEATGTLHPVASGGSFPQITLQATAPEADATTTLAAIRAAARKQVKAKAKASPTPTVAADAPATAAGAPLPATVTLNYAPDRAGTNVWVQPLQSGTLSTLDAQGKTVTSTRGFPLTIGAAGSVTFTFQAPATPNSYQVYTRLDNVTTTLNFLVPDPE